MDPSQKVAGIKLLTTATTTWRGGTRGWGRGLLEREGKRRERWKGKKRILVTRKGRIGRGEWRVESGAGVEEVWK